MRRQHFDQLEADFQQYYNLDVEQVPAPRAARLMFQLPRTGRVFTILDPTNHWGWLEVLLNKLNYNVEILAWQNTKDAQKKPPKNAPKLYVPEFMQDVLGAKAMTKDAAPMKVKDMKAYLARPRKPVQSK